MFSAFRVKEYDRSLSPDGKYVAVAKYRAFRSWLPTNPGGSGDMPGWVTLFTKEGKSLGSLDVDMVSVLKDIQWTDHTAEIRTTGEWQLN